MRCVFLSHYVCLFVIFINFATELCQYLSFHAHAIELLLIFTVDQLEPVHDITVLFLSNNKLLVGEFETYQLFVYSREGHRLFNFTISGSLMDASWTPKGYIV